MEMLSMDSISIAPYCYEAIARQFAERGLPVEAFTQGVGDQPILNPFSGGREAMGFQSPEVKVPRVGLELIEAFEFRDATGMQLFCERFPDLADRCRLMPPPRGKVLASS